MSLVGLVQLTARLLNQTLQDSQESQQGPTKNAGTVQNTVSTGTRIHFCRLCRTAQRKQGFFR